MVVMVVDPPTCPDCGGIMRVESSIYGGPYEYRCPNCGYEPTPDPSSAPRRPLPKVA